MITSNSSFEPDDPQTNLAALTEVCVRRYGSTPSCDVVITFRGRQTTIRCDDYTAASKWAHMECKSYGIAGGFKIEDYA
jgi:hypothetical protein